MEQEAWSSSWLHWVAGLKAFESVCTSSRVGALACKRRGWGTSEWLERMVTVCNVESLVSGPPTISTSPALSKSESLRLHVPALSLIAFSILKALVTVSGCLAEPVGFPGLMS